MIEIPKAAVDALDAAMEGELDGLSPDEPILRRIIEHVVPHLDGYAAGFADGQEAMREALQGLANAADDVGVRFFDADTMEPEVEAMQDATQAARKLLAEIDALPIASAPSPWRPISEAKQDGTRYILAKIADHLARPTDLWWACAGYWSKKWENWNDGVEPCGLAGPTHFMEIPKLPAPPASEKEPQE